MGAGVLGCWGAGYWVLGARPSHYAPRPAPRDPRPALCASRVIVCVLGIAERSVGHLELNVRHEIARDVPVAACDAEIDATRRRRRDELQWTDARGAELYVRTPPAAAGFDARDPDYRKDQPLRVHRLPQVAHVPAMNLRDVDTPRPFEGEAIAFPTSDATHLEDLRLHVTAIDVRFFAEREGEWNGEYRHLSDFGAPAAAMTRR